MKNYIANGVLARLKKYLALTNGGKSDQGHWDTSRALVRRLLERCIHLGRQHRAKGLKQDEYEAYRLLGTAVSFVPFSS